MDEIDEYIEGGLLARIDSLALMRGEEVAIITGSLPTPQGSFVPNIDEHSVSSEDQSIGSSGDFSADPEGITYTELQFAYQDVASQLRFRCGVNKGDAVLLCCKGSVVAEVVSMLACLKLGVTFVPVDESWMNVGTRLKDIIENANPAAALVVAENDTDYAVTALAIAGLYRCIYLNANGEIVESFNTLRDNNGFAVETYSYDNGDDVATEDDLLPSVPNDIPLYILYTSGSTGRPKGVRGTHTGLLNRIAWQLKTFPFQEGEVVCRRTPLVFVDAMAEVFSALVGMVDLWCPPRDRMLAEGIGGVAGQANESGVSRLTLLPSQLQQALVLHPNLAEIWPALRIVFVSGEECTTALVSLVKERLPDVTLVNLYGSTEVAGDVSYAVLHTGLYSAPLLPAAKKVSQIDKVPIGCALEGNHIFIVKYNEADKEFRILGDDEVGEVMVVGKHVADGYHNISDSTISSGFIYNPLRNLPPSTDQGNLTDACGYEYAFLMGDLGYRSAADKLLYLTGRKDRQVKIRGTRLELEDAERQIGAGLGLQDSSVVVLAVDTYAQNTTNTGDSDTATGDHSTTNIASSLDTATASATAATKILVLQLEYSTIRATNLPIVSIKEKLRDLLIPAIVPAIVLPVQDFPRTTSGKIDRKLMQASLEELLPRSTEHTQSTEAESNTCTNQYASTATLLMSPNKEELINEIQSLTHSELCHRIMHLYADILGVTAPIDVSYEEIDFYQLGGDSVRLIEVLWRLRQWTSGTVNSEDLQQTIEKLACQFHNQKVNVLQEDAENPSKRTKRNNSSTATITTTTTADTSSEEQGGSNIPSCYPTPTQLTSFSAAPHTLPFTVSRCHTGTYIDPLASIASNATATIAIAWSTKLLKCIDASPLLIVWPDLQELKQEQQKLETANLLPVHLVVVGSHGGDVAAVDGRTGETVWLLQLGEHVEAAAAFDPQSSLMFVGSFPGNDVDGFSSRRAPTAAAGVTDSNNSITPALGCLWALDASTGKIHWHLTTAGEIKSTPLVVDGFVFIASYDGHLYQVNCRDGALLNKYPCGGSVYASPVLSADGSKVIVVTTSGNLVQFARSPEPSGCLTLLHSSHLVAMFSTPFTFMPPSESPQQQQQEEAIVLAGTDGTLRRLRLSDSEEIWCETVSATSFFSSSCHILQENSAIIGCHDGILRKFSVLTGGILWERRIGVAIFASPHLRNNNKECVIATVAGDVLIICVKEGKILAKQRLPAEVFSSPVCIDHRIYIGCRDNRLYCLSV